MLLICKAVAPSRTHGLRILRHLSNPPSMSTATGNPNAAQHKKKHLIERKLTEGLAPALLQVEDVSHQHAGHAGAPKGSSETHFNVTVVSDQFQGRTLLKRHRLVYDLLHDELQHGGVHALSLNTKTPAEVAPKP
jgi:stress-induced morphogen